ncbi:ATP-binding cassette domain-containing protein [Gynuella sunshinyii]|uniref:ABC-type transport system involved in cytochrome bd biosynthesis, fused ATPase and permease component n=1 Tax=Gynuella sunshinyii YC6258 TaxID=1445510 RepID=A0A0C5VX64_9GAMM|nr:ATP-binding cassette domain-containing protein [Gynuella sunshinyii]AJQ97918.1 ABC-type transport system involved in cytochrome bd biosynthesis, fused ATPase and permease component [Gynuella sunshinyii YC6258]
MIRISALLLAVINAAAGLTLLLLSGWFIAAAAVAGLSPLALNFNYVVPSTLIRLLAFIRIISGYGEKYIGHASLFDILGTLRLKLFSQVMQSSQTAPRAGELEKLTLHVESLANASLSYLHPNLSALTLATAVGITLIILAPGQLSLFIATMLLVIGLIILQYQRLRDIKQRLNEQQSVYRFELEHYLRSAPLWNYQLTHQALNQQEQQWLNHVLTLQTRQHQSEWSLLLLSSMALVMAIYTTPDTLTGSPYALLVFLVYIAMPDWLGNGVRAISAGIDARQARLAIATDSIPEKLPAESSSAPVNIHHLQLQGFGWQRNEQVGQPLNLQLQRGNILWIKGSSGSGKSSLLMALGALLPFYGILRLNGQTCSHWRPASLLYIEQFPYILSDSLRNNLLLAAPDADDTRLAQALQFARLETLLQEGLDQWLGELGRDLSGGEKKRLGLARAWLSNAPVWLLDEPFEGLDQQTRDALTNNLEAIRDQHIVMIASHIEPQHIALTHIVDLDQLTL